ncbi:MAG: 23S rRNA (adenine(2503)-C(2))-methyltransferase RlmN [Alphaproteobacteria bacterium]
METAPPRRSLIGLSRTELGAALAAAGVAEDQLKMRVSQLWNWLYVRGARDFAEMSNLAKDFRRDMTDHFTIARAEVADRQVSADGTRKWLIRFGPGLEAETVYIPEEDRGTLCISSQIGCTLNCSFCHTGTQKLVRNLTAEEILQQILIARDDLSDWPKPGLSRDAQAHRAITNIVMMGMGEPLYNFDNVKAALLIAADGDGLGYSKRRITLSTSGVVPEMPRIANEIGVMLAVSLHAVNDETRDRLVPLNKKYPLAELFQACREFPGATNARRITFEYVMLKGVNDSPEDARALVRLLSGIPAKINLIPFNPWPGAPYECSDWETIETFAEIVNRAGYASPVRTPRGRDIMAACGQLRSASVKERASARRQAPLTPTPSS